jgi:lipopolysaccharide transport system permease protein
MSAAPTVVIDANRRGLPVELSRLWKSRELLLFLAWRDLRVRYKQTALGIAWAIVQPLMTMIVFSVFFGHFARMPSDGLPYPVFALSALLPWSLFASAFTQSGQSLVNNHGLVTKVYFPRLIIPLAPLLVGLADFAVAFVLLLVIMLWYGVLPGAMAFTLPVFVLLALAAALAAGVWLAALSVRFRDVRHLLPFLTQVWLLATPIAYPISLLPEPWRTISGLNPMAGVVEGFRCSLVGRTPLPIGLLAVSVAIIVVLLVTGLAYFERRERYFADVL